MADSTDINITLETTVQTVKQSHACIQKIKNLIIDKESNGMLNLITLQIKDKETEKAYKQGKVGLFYSYAEMLVVFTNVTMIIHALNYWVLGAKNVP